MSKQVKVFNPFYILLMIVGIAFAFTALGYGVMSVKMLEPDKLVEHDDAFVTFFDEHGTTLFVAELAILAVLTLLAITTDGFWTRLAEKRHARQSISAENQATTSAEQPSARNTL